VELNGTGDTAYYNYDGGGQRVRKVVVKSGRRTERLYLGGVERYREYSASSVNNPNGTVEQERWTVQIDDIAQVDTLTVDNSATVGSPVPLIRYQYRDHLGSAAMETNENGAVISYEEYHPFGTSAYRTAKSNTDLSLKRYRFTNKDRDDERGLYYFGVRYYAAWLGRWTSSDPGDFVDGLNLYQYAQNNPVKLVDAEGYKAEPPPDDLADRGEATETEPEYREQFDGVEREDRVTTRFSFDEKNGLVLTIVVTGKVIDYTEQGTSLLWGESAAEAIARRINAFGNNELWIGENGLFTTSVSKVDASGMKFGIDGEVREFDEITVKFEFNFEAAESILEASPDDHVIALLPEPSKDRHKALEEDRTINGITSSSQKIAFVNINTFTGLNDWSLGYGEAVTVHEIISHFMGLGHADKINGRSNTGGGVYCYSDCISPEEARRILINTQNPEFGSGAHSVPHRLRGEFQTFLIPNTAYSYSDSNGFHRGRIGDLGFDMNIMINYEWRKQQLKK
jgi:RHS repeat-associated protein